MTIRISPRGAFLHIIGIGIEIRIGIGGGQCKHTIKRYENGDIDGTCK